MPGQLEEIQLDYDKVHNIGVGGANPADYLELLENIKFSEEDTIIVVLYDNDLHLTARNCKQIQTHVERYNIKAPRQCEVSDAQFVDTSRKGFLRQVNWHLKNFKTVELVKESLVNVPFISDIFYRTEYQAKWADFGAEETIWLIKSLQEIEKVVRNRNAKLLLAYYPNTNAIVKDDLRHVTWLKFIQYFEQKTNLEILDPYPFFIKNAPDRSMVWSLTDKHPNCAAHGLMAKFLAQHLN